LATNGDLHDISAADLIQNICLDQRTAYLILNQQSQQARLFFNNGSIFHAMLGEQQGEEVVYEVLNWTEGTFYLDYQLQESDLPVTITRSWQGVLLEGARRRDEAENLVQINKENQKMATIKETLDAIMAFDGAIATALVDWSSGITLGTAGTGMEIELAAAGNANVVRAKMSVMKDLKIKGGIEDILITLTDQYHLIRMLHGQPNIFVYVALSRAQANLGLARHKLSALEHDLELG
jgi:hypothetical protein